MTLEDIRRVCSGAWATPPVGEKPILDLAIDTRVNLPAPDQTLFVALSGNQRSGSDFLPQAYSKGIRAFLLSAPPREPLPADASVLIVPDTRQALQDLARSRRQQFKGPVLAITGSNGKTVVKEWLYELLSPDKKVLRSPKSYNSQVGVPLSVWLLRPGYDLAVFEAGISGMGEMKRLEAILKPQIGIFTNLGEAHQAGFENRRQKALEKALLFRDCKTIFYCIDYPEITEAFQQLGYGEDAGKTVVSYSISGNPAATWQVSQIEREDFHTRFTLYNEKERVALIIPFNDDASLENAVCCWLVARHLNIPESVLSERLLRLHPVAMRLEFRKGTHGCTLINDAYNSDLTSLRIALTALQNQAQHAHKTVILSDLLQAGVAPEVLYEVVAALLRGAGLKTFIGIGPELMQHRHLFEAGTAAEVHFFESTSAFFRALPEIHFHDEAILLKGARSFAFERIVALLEQEVHRTVLTIDLAALTENLDIFRKKIQKGVRLMAMVKAFAYGSGSHEIAGALQDAGVDYLAVAYTDEGVALRQKNIRLPIMVMSPDVGSFERIIAWNLEPEIFNFRSLAAFTRAARALDVTGYPVHLKLNTGMNRLGFDTAEIPKLIAEISSNNTLYVKSIFSHLAGSEDECLDGFTEEQAAVFGRNAKAIATALNDTPLLHLTNSSGILRHPQYQFDMVRLGLGMYGIDSTARNLALRPVSSLRTTIAQIRRVAAGEGVSYGQKGVSAEPRRIATVCVGYADGYPRALGHGKAYMLVRGRKAYTVGTVCMDMCMLDVTHIPSVKEGDDVLVFGPELSPVLLAGWADTIPYEILTGISQRVKRIYLNEM